jgi:hypothetical protein
VDNKQCCVVELKERQQSVDEFDGATIAIVRNVLQTRQRQVLRSINGPYDDQTVIRNLAKTYGVYYSDPTNDEIVLIARMRVYHDDHEIRADAWFANNTISEVVCSPCEAIGGLGGMDQEWLQPVVPPVGPWCVCQDCR